MDKKDYIDYWVNTSQSDLESMEVNFQMGKNDWALFIGHLVIEKILKALWVKNNDENIPPKTHNLLRLAESAKLILNENDIIFLNRVSNFQLETRYPDYKMDFYKLCTKEFTEENVNKIKDFYKCIKEKI